MTSMNSNKCARCEQTVYPVEGLRCLDKLWHKGCFKCQECGMTLNMKNYKGFDKKPYCNAHCPQAKATTVADTPEIRRLAENTRIQSQAKYHEDFEKSKGKGFTTIADDPETLRIKETSKIISDVAYHGEIERKKQMEEKRTAKGAGAGSEISDTQNNNSPLHINNNINIINNNLNHKQQQQQQQNNIKMNQDNHQGQMMRTSSLSSTAQQQINNQVHHQQQQQNMNNGKSQQAIRNIHTNHLNNMEFAVAQQQQQHMAALQQQQQLQLHQQHQQQQIQFAQDIHNGQPIINRHSVDGSSHNQPQRQIAAAAAFAKNAMKHPSPTTNQQVHLHQQQHQKQVQYPMSPQQQQQQQQQLIRQQQQQHPQHPQLQQRHSMDPQKMVSIQQQQYHLQQQHQHQQQAAAAAMSLKNAHHTQSAPMMKPVQMVNMQQLQQQHSPIHLISPQAGANHQMNAAARATGVMPVAAGGHRVVGGVPTGLVIGSQAGMMAQQANLNIQPPIQHQQFQQLQHMANGHVNQKQQQQQFVPQQQHQSQRPLIHPNQQQHHHMIQQAALNQQQQQQARHQQQQFQQQMLHHPQAMGGSGKRMFRAMYDYVANDVDEVSFFENDMIIDAVNVDGNWLIGKVARSGQTGMLPANYVAEVISN